MTQPFWMRLLERWWLGIAQRRSTTDTPHMTIIPSMRRTTGETYHRFAKLRLRHERSASKGVWWCGLPEISRRPVVVLSRDAAIPRLRRTLTAPCTTTIRGLASEVRLEPGDDPIPLLSAVNLDLVESVSIGTVLSVWVGWVTIACARDLRSFVGRRRLQSLIENVGPRSLEPSMAAFAARMQQDRKIDYGSRYRRIRGGEMRQVWSSSRDPNGFGLWRRMACDAIRIRCSASVAMRSRLQRNTMLLRISVSRARRNGWAD